MDLILDTKPPAGKLLSLKGDDYTESIATFFQHSTTDTKSEIFGEESGTTRRKPLTAEHLDQFAKTRFEDDLLKNLSFSQELSLSRVPTQIESEIELGKLEIPQSYKKKITNIYKLLNHEYKKEFESQLGQILIEISDDKLLNIPEKLFDLWEHRIGQTNNEFEMINAERAKSLIESGLKKECLPGYISESNKQFITCIFTGSDSSQRTIVIPLKKVNLKKKKKYQKISLNSIQDNSSIKYWFEEIQETNIEKEYFDQAAKKIDALFGPDF